MARAAKYFSGDPTVSSSLGVSSTRWGPNLIHNQGKRRDVMESRESYDFRHPGAFVRMLVGEKEKGMLGFCSLRFEKGMKRNGELLLMYFVCFNSRADAE
jgi:hypothetical protein